MKDEQLVTAFQHGERDAFDKLVLRYQDKVLNTCFRFLGDADEAHDATQDIFIKVYRALDRFKPRAKFSTWLYRIAVNHSLNLVRSKKRRSRLRTFSLLGAEQSQIGLIVDHAAHPDSRIEKKERSECVHRALEKLNEEQRIAIILHRFEDLSYKEIATIMNTSVSSVESRLFRARQKLAKLLQFMLD
ncbi:sigma-70 family RNA polymerase sigma factor [candidate division KSB1 bacterium]|nr:sigma-70 family RNA polymerase sigma factor [candidate division KSB1 bacterium]